jgi:hypothetical protein
MMEAVAWIGTAPQPGCVQGQSVRSRVIAGKNLSRRGRPRDQTSRGAEGAMRQAHRDRPTPYCRRFNFFHLFLKSIRIYTQIHSTALLSG